MFYYEGLSCPVCSKAFSQDDDIVVCPQCGLPHHRECWKSIGRCYEADKHGTAEQWSRERAQNAAPKPTANAVMHTCPHCNTQNAEYAEFCARCGYPLNVEDWHSAPQTHAPFVGEYTHYGQPRDYYSSAERIGESNAADLAAVVGNNTQYYMERFRRIESGRSGGWNWAAFLLSPMWLFYRKQYGLGVVFLILQLMSGVAYTVMYAPAAAATTAEEVEALMLAAMNGPMFIFVAILAVILLALQILLGMRANHFYLNHCEQKIAKAKQNAPNLSAAELTSVGGVSLGIAVLVYLLSTILIDLISTMITTMLL